MNGRSNMVLKDRGEVRSGDVVVVVVMGEKRVDKNERERECV